jgi:predicted metal-dependent hydrolase
MSVENFFQESIFEDIFPSVPAISPVANFQPMRSPKSAPLLPTRESGGQGALALGQEFRVIRSARRKRGVSASRNNGVIEIHIPDRTTRRAERELIPEMIAMVLEREAKKRRGNGELEAIAARVLEELLPEFHERPSSITWRSMQGRWGSCTTVDGTIRIAARLASAPAYVLECVIFHELIHLRISDHGGDFTALLHRYPHLERAEAFLEGFEAGLACPPESIESELLA